MMLNTINLLSKIFLTVFLFITFFILKPVVSHAAQQYQVWKLEYANVMCGTSAGDSINKNYDFNSTGDIPPSNPVPANEKIRLPFIAYDKLQTCRLRLEFRHLRLSSPIDEGGGNYTWHTWQGARQKIELRPFKAEKKTIIEPDLAAENISLNEENRLIAGKSPTGFWMYTEMPLTKLFPSTTGGKLKNPNVVSPDVLKDKQASLKIYVGPLTVGAGGFIFHSGRIYLTLPAYKLDKSIQNNIKLN